IILAASLFIMAAPTFAQKVCLEITSSDLQIKTRVHDIALADLGKINRFDVNDGAGWNCYTLEIIADPVLDAYDATRTGLVGITAFFLRSAKCQYQPTDAPIGCNALRGSFPVTVLRRSLIEVRIASIVQQFAEFPAMEQKAKSQYLLEKQK
ncbi:MAG: hypothetical protein ACRD43_00005, partial [Pyrinomonadaceae bacterium]